MLASLALVGCPGVVAQTDPLVSSWKGAAPVGNYRNSLEVDVLPRLAHDNQLAVHRHGGFWQCMDTYRDMTLLNEMWAGGKAPWKVWK